MIPGLLTFQIKEPNWKQGSFKGVGLCRPYHGGGGHCEQKEPGRRLGLAHRGGLAASEMGVGVGSRLNIPKNSIGKKT